VSTTTLKVDWDDDTINAVRTACLAAAEAYESMGASLPGNWNLSDALHLRAAAEDIRAYVWSREAVRQDHIIRELRRALAGITATEKETP
jgi:hypothetical protein